MRNEKGVFYEVARPKGGCIDAICGTACMLRLTEARVERYGCESCGWLGRISRIVAVSGVEGLQRACEAEPKGAEA